MGGLRRKHSKAKENPTIPIAPMIDCVFLMLVYFMTTSSLQREEADLAFELPVPGKGEVAPAVQSRQTLVINDQGKGILNNYAFPSYAEDGHAALEKALSRFHESCLSAGKSCQLELVPQGKAPQQAVIWILDSIHRVGIEDVRFR